MRSLIKLGVLCGTLLVLAACSSTSAPKRLSEAELDQKSYAAGYETTAQTYADRVNSSYDIEAFMKGVNEWFSGKVALPIEQIRAGMFERMIDHNVYAYNSGVLFASELQQKFHYLNPNCWAAINTPSLAQGIGDSMYDLKAGKKRNDQYLNDGVEKMYQLCVPSSQAAESKAVKKSTKAKK